ncbi:MAG: hypothetical protein H6582_06665 [Crocinitomicaceae bacterium]|nr:hypothetical protein [Crocinitomicaceae bacterium]
MNIKIGDIFQYKNNEDKYRVIAIDNTDKSKSESIITAENTKTGFTISENESLFLRNYSKI